MITTYQIRNVLRIYGKQLKKKAMLLQDGAAPTKQPPDSINISVEARRKEMLNRISNNMVSEITQNAYQPKTDRNNPDYNLSLNPNVERKNYEN